MVDSRSQGGIESPYRSVLVKDIKGMELAQAIKEVGAGRSLLDNRAAAALMAKLRDAAEHSDPLSGLSD